jgi:hypothetical protein
MAGIGLAAIWLAIACWHPLLAFGIAFLALFPVSMAMVSRRRGLIFSVAAMASTIICLLWFKSNEISFSVGWGPSSVLYQATNRRGQVHFFRFVRHGGGNLRPWLGAEEPGTEHWSDWPGFYEERFPVRVPGVEFARSKYLVPIGMRPAVDYADVITLSHWLILTLYLTLALAFACWARRRSPPPADSLEPPKPVE